MEESLPSSENVDELIEYLITNIESLTELHGDPTPKLLKTIVSEFLKKIMWDKESLDAIIRVWGKFPPPNTHGIIGMLESIFVTISRSQLEFCITPSYIQIFRDSPTLRISRTILSPKINRFFVLFEHQFAWKYFFKKRVFKGFSIDGNSDEDEPEVSCDEFRDFLFNDVIEEYVDRIELIRLIVFKTILLFMDIDEGIHMIDCVLCIMGALQNTMIIKQEIRNGRVERKRKWDDRDEGLSDILTIIGKPSFYKTMFGVWLNKKNR